MSRPASHPSTMLKGLQQSAPRDAETSGVLIERRLVHPMDIDDTSAVNPRKPISRRVRFEVLRRDNYTCRYCGAKAPDVPLTVDHVIPTTLGGSDDPSNLVTACRDCNAGKSSTSPDEHLVADVDQMALKYAAALDRATDLRRIEMHARDAQLREFYNFQHDIFEKPDTWLVDGWEASVGRFLDARLSVSELKHFTYVMLDAHVQTRNAFRYFCGCCWNEIRTRQTLALDLLKDD